jgi:hypothetical protein
MAFYLGTTSIYPGVLPTPSATTTGAPLMNDGTNAFWSYPGESHTVAGTGWQYRTILTHGYVAAGYKGYSPWRSINKTWHQTDTTVYCGEQLDRAGAYLDGTFSDYSGYVHATNDTWTGTSTHTSSYNLSTGIMRMQNNNNFSFFGSATAPYGYQGSDPKNEGVQYGDQTSLGGHGGWDLSVARSYIGCASSTPGNGATDGAGYIFCGGSVTTNKLHFPSEVMYATTSAPSNMGPVASVGGQTKAYIVGASSTANMWTMPWSNDTFSTWAWPSSTTSDGQNKHLMTKLGFFYAGVGSNTDTRIWKFSDSTSSYISALTKLGSFGEENQQMGQNWGYMLGMFNGQQNNWTTKTTYSTDAMVTMGFATQPKGHYGASSGCCSSAAASITSVQRA